MISLSDVQSFLWSLLAYGGGSTAIAYLVFKALGQGWLESKFAERLETLRHQQALELQRLRVEVDSLLAGAVRLQEREFAVLPDAWAKLDDAHGLLQWLTAPMQQYPDVERMNPEELEECLEAAGFSLAEKNRVRAQTSKAAVFQEILVWRRMNRVKASFGDLQSYVARNGIFLPASLKEKFSKIAEIMWQAIVAKEVGHQARDWKMQAEGWAKVKEQAEPLYRAIEAEIHERLQSHGLSPNG